MIIECVNCNKKFNVDAKLIPENGRQIKCGSCDHVWHFKIESSLKKPLILNSENNQEKISIIDNTKEITKNKTEERKKNTTDQNNIKIIKISNFFSFLLVFIISSVALIILLDTLKSPLINIFPGLEIILFNLFETLKDIKLFITDLT